PGDRRAQRRRVAAQPRVGLSRPAAARGRGAGPGRDARRRAPPVHADRGGPGLRDGARGRGQRALGRGRPQRRRRRDGAAGADRAGRDGGRPGDAGGQRRPGGPGAQDPDRRPPQPVPDPRRRRRAGRRLGGRPGRPGRLTGGARLVTELREAVGVAVAPDAEKTAGNGQRAPMAITVAGLTKNYGEIEAVRGIDFEVPTGETFGFLGPNGAGKSTTIKILCTLARPTSGTARVAGHDVTTERDRVRRNIGLVFQDTTLDNYLTGAQNLRFHAELYGVPAATVAPRMQQVMEMVGL